MARITLGNGRWSVIRGYINSMFAELYSLIGSGSGGGGSIGKYEYKTNLLEGLVTTVITPAVIEPYSVMVLDSTGKIITAGLDIDVRLSNDIYVLDIYSVDAISNVTIKVLY